MEQELLGDNSPLQDIIIEKECRQLIDSFRDVVSQPTKKDEDKKALEAAIICQKRICSEVSLNGKIGHYHLSKLNYLESLL